MTDARSTPESSQACVNTDREIWREREGDFYADSIHVTERGGIGINCGGMVYVKPLREWHRIAKEAERLTTRSESVAFVAPINPAAMEQKTVDTVARDAARYRFRHSSYVDKDGYEYGYCKVRWKGGAVDSMLWADDEEIDAAMAAAGFK